jgi:glutamyl-tRNA synthetase
LILQYLKLFTGVDISLNMPSVRVRFAPSPTGYPHLGNIRTALFTWLFARHHEGVFILRIEDTDINRKVEGSVDAIQDSLRWLGLDWDEGPYFQSQRLDLYRESADRLLKDGFAYRCYCTPERLEAMRQEQIRKKQPPKYDGHCRHLTDEEKTSLESSKLSSVVRLKIPIDGETSFSDILHGTLTFKNQILDDLILLKSDGYPTYHLANVVDDHDMKITHVIRADEWLSSTPRHMLLYNAFGWNPPLFVHLPMLLGPDRSKLSKRHGATTITDYRDQGYLPEAMINYLALLGWSLDDKTEIISKDELIKYFSLKRVSKTSAIFDQRKLEWMNGVYLRKLSLEEFNRLSVPILEKELDSTIKRPLDKDYVNNVLPLLQERIKTMAEITQLAEFFFLEDLKYDTNLLIRDGLNAESALVALKVTLARLKEESVIWDPTTLENTLRPLIAELGLNARQYLGLLRTATTGRTAAPPLFDTMVALGKETSLERLTKAYNMLAASQ